MAGPMDWPNGEDEDVDVAGGEDVMGMSVSDFGEKGLNAMLMSLFFFFWLIGSDTLVHCHHGHQVHRQPISASSGQNELGEKFQKKISVLTNY